MLISIKSWLDLLQEWPSSIAIRESIYGYTALLSLHVLSMCLFFGLVLMMDLRLMGVGNMRTPFSQLQRRLFPWQMFGMVVSAVTGVMLIYGQPSRFYSNIFFYVKMMMLAAWSMRWRFIRAVSTSVSGTRGACPGREVPFVVEHCGQARDSSRAA
jgi:hypothetical protein